MPSDVETINGDAAPATVSCNESERIMEGLVLPWGDTGATATGSIPAPVTSPKPLARLSVPKIRPKA